MAATHGIKKVSENILAPGRAIVVTEKDKDKYTWGDIPDGSLFVDTTTGIMAVKLEGESDWVPAGIKNDGTINIAKDNITKVESFTIEQETVPGNKDEFIYTNSEGQQRHGVKKWNTGGAVLEGYIFTLENGTYIMHRNHLKVTIDDVLHRSVATGGIEEINEQQFLMTEKLEDKMEITVEYNAAFRMGLPYPRFFMNGEAPLASEVGDFWLDTDATLEENGPLEDMEDNQKIGWDRIENTPTTLAGYGITDQLAKAGHIHTVNDILGLPTALPANGGHAKSADFAYSAGTAKKADMTSVANMAINDGNNERIDTTYLKKDGVGARGKWDISISGKADSAYKAEVDILDRKIIDTYVTKDGAVMTGALNLANNVWNTIGDDVFIGDRNHSGTLCIKGNNGSTGITLVKRGTDEKNFATITYDGETISVSKTMQANITGNAGSASYVDWKNVGGKPESYKAEGGRSDTSDMASSVWNDSAGMRMHWTGKENQPAWVWGGNDAANMYIYNPSNFYVAYAEEANHSATSDRAETLSGHIIGTGANQIPLLDKNGKFPSNVIPTVAQSVKSQFVCAGGQPKDPQQNQVWFDTNSMLIKVYMGTRWVAFGAVYK